MLARKIATRPTMQRGTKAAPTKATSAKAATKAANPKAGAGRAALRPAHSEADTLEIEDMFAEIDRNLEAGRMYLQRIADRA